MTVTNNAPPAAPAASEAAPTPAPAAPAVQATPPAAPAAPAASAPAATPAGQATPASGEPAAAPAEVVYTLTLPEGSELGAQAVERTTALAKTLGLSSDHAQKALEFAHAEVAAYRQSLEAESAKMRHETWVAETMADPEIGGAKFAQTNLDAAAARKAGMNPAFDAMLIETGLGNHPEMVRFCAYFGRMLRGDTTFIRGEQPAPQPVERTTAEVLYGGTTPKAGG